MLLCKFDFKSAYRSIHSIHHELIRTPKPAEDNVPFTAAKPMMADPGVGEHGTMEVFLDDIFSAFPAISAPHVQRGAQATPLALEIIARPLLETETVSRDDMLAITKALAEGAPAKELAILGWIIDTWRLLVKLPQNKFITWSQSVHGLLSRQGQHIDFSTLETLVGRLLHVANILQISRHFLNHLRAAMLRAKVPSHVRPRDTTASAMREAGLYVLLPRAPLLYGTYCTVSSLLARSPFRADVQSRHSANEPRAQYHLSEYCNTSTPAPRLPVDLQQYQQFFFYLLFSL